MKIYGELHDDMSVKEQLFATNKVRNTNGWFDKLFSKYDFSGRDKDVLFEGSCLVKQNDKCVVRWQLTPTGDLMAFVVDAAGIRCIVFDRLSCEGRVDFSVSADYFEREKQQKAL